MSQAQEVSSGAKWGIWGSVVILVAAFLAYFYVPKTEATYVPLAILGLGFIGALVVFFVSPTGKSFLTFAKDAYREARKVVWPTRGEVLKLTGVVFAFVAVLAFFMWGVDKFLEWFLYDFILSGK
ncbi:MAG: preprotein translocase subunit SecE [Formosimonas sp.]